MEQEFRGVKSLSSVIASLEQRYLNRFKVDEEEEDDTLPPIGKTTTSTTTEEPKKRSRGKKKLKATKEEEELLLDGFGFIDDSEIVDELDEPVFALATASAGGANVSTAALASEQAVPQLAKLIPIPSPFPASASAAAAASGDTPAPPTDLYTSSLRNTFLLRYLDEFNGNAQVYEAMRTLSRCIMEEMMENEFNFSKEIEESMLQVDLCFLKQQPVRSKGYLAHLLSLFPQEVSKQVLVAHLQRLFLKHKLDGHERNVQVKLKWTLEAIQKARQRDAVSSAFRWDGQSRSCAYLLGEACRQAQRTRERLEVWLLERKRDLAQFSTRRAYKLKSKPSYFSASLNKICRAFPCLTRSDVKQAMEEFPADHYFLDETGNFYIPFKYPVMVEAAAAAAPAEALIDATPSPSPAAATGTTGTSLASQNLANGDGSVVVAATAVSTAASSSANKGQDGEHTQPPQTNAQSIKEVFKPYKGKRFQKYEFKPEDFEVKKVVSASTTATAAAATASSTPKKNESSQ